MSLTLQLTAKVSYLLLLLLLSTENARSTNERSITLAGTRKKLPNPGISEFSDNADLARLLHVGPCGNNIVPPLDGTLTGESVKFCKETYAMKFVFYDLQLVELKSVDPVGGSFRAEIQMVFHWLDYLDEHSYDGSNGKNCSFLCDDMNPQSRLCCDDVWVPPLRLPGCDLSGLQSSSPAPFSHYPVNDNVFSLEDCLIDPAKNNGSYNCVWRRLWYLNIDVVCKSEMNFHNFPFDVQTLAVDIFNPHSRRTWFQFTKGFLERNVDQGINDVNLSPGTQYAIFPRGRFSALWGPVRLWIASN